MKYIYYTCLCLLIIFYHSCQSPPIEIPDPEPLNLLSDCTQALDNWIQTTALSPDLPAQHDIFFTNKDVGFTVGNYGIINKTEDGGRTWNLIYHGDFENYITQLNLNNIFFLDEQIGFVTGERKGCCFGEELDLGAIFLKTDNGGDTWEKQYFENFKRISDLFFLTAEIGYGIFKVDYTDNGTKQIIMQTINGGETWIEVDVPISFIAYNQFFSSPSKLYFIAKDDSEKEVFVYLDKNDRTWHIQDAPEIDCNRLYFINDNIGFVSCGAFPMLIPEQVYETQNGGYTWTETDFPLTNDALLYFSSVEEGFVISPIFESHLEDTDDFIDIIAYDIFQTDNGGADWKTSSYVPECNFIGEATFNMFFIPTDDVIINYGARNINIFERK